MGRAAAAGPGGQNKVRRAITARVEEQKKRLTWTRAWMAGRMDNEKGAQQT